MLLRGCLMPLRALGVMGRRFVLASGYMFRRRLMMFRALFAAVRQFAAFMCCSCVFSDMVFFFPFL